MLDVGWCCPRCSLVLAPHVTEHRCAPPSAGVTAILPQNTPGPWPASITAHQSVTGDSWTTVTTATTGHLGVAPITHYRAADGTITEATPGRLEIAGGSAA